jgi:hypothetical protein
MPLSRCGTTQGLVNSRCSGLTVREDCARPRDCDDRGMCQRARFSRPAGRHQTYPAVHPEFTENSPVCDIVEGAKRAQPCHTGTLPGASTCAMVALP